MPLFEYICRGCARRFETLVMGSTRPTCPHCGDGDLEKQFSTFAVAGSARTSNGDADSFEEPAPCGSCGDPRGPGSCAID